MRETLFGARVTLESASTGVLVQARAPGPVGTRRAGPSTRDRPPIGRED